MAHRVIHICAAVAFWWIGNTIATIFSKNVMNKGKEATFEVWGLTNAFLDFRWLELTLLQHVLGGVIGYIWLILIKGKPLYPETNISKLDIIFASLGNAVGNLATNAAYSFVSSSSVQILKGLEPLVTFVLTIFLYRTGGVFTIEILISILMICVGASSFVVWDSNFNVWGVTAALISDIAFPFRNIFLKRVYWESPLQKYTFLSLLSALFILPALLVKLIVIQTLSLSNIEYGFTSSLFHFIYNLASISVLENVTPMTHSILNLSKRLFVVILNIIYFSTLLSKTMIFGLLTFFIGIFVFQMYNNKNNTTQIFRLRMLQNGIVKAILIGFSIIMCLLFIGSIPMQASKNKDTHIRNYDKILTVWLYNDPIPQDVVSNVKSFLNHGNHLDVYCGTTQCINAFQPLPGDESISVQFLDISRIVQKTPFESWFARQVYHKILTGRNFEKHLYEVVKISLLWHHGGIYLSPTLALLNGQYLPSTTNDSWTSFGTDTFDENLRNALDISFFTIGHPMLTKLATDFVNNYPSEGSDDLSNWPVEYNYRKVLMNSLAESCEAKILCINEYPITTHVLDAELAKNSKCHFGTFSYDTRVTHIGAGNLGDEVQSFPGIQFLPYLDTFLDREELVSSFQEPTVVFFNAWWGDSRMNFPPPENIDPIALGMHFASGVRDRNNLLDFAKHSTSLGSRDMDTYDWLRTIGVETFFSSCLTLLTRSPTVNRENPKSIYLVDVKEEFLKLIPVEVRETAISLEQNAPTEILNLRIKRFKSAFEMIEAYSEAKLVITQRIHCALPSAAMGIPVIFINSDAMPGDGGTNTASSARTVGLTDYFHTVNTYSFSMEQTMEFFLNFNYSSPPHNPNINLLMKARAVSWNVIRQRQPLYDAARKFGLLPFPTLRVLDNELVFHFAFTSSRNSFTFDHSSSSPSHTLINFRNRRSIESVFYHHSLSKIIIHSNTLYQTDFDVYTESGYRVEVLNYELSELFKMSPIVEEVDFDRIQEMEKMDDWPLFENYIVQLLVLYQSGGIYLNTDTFLLVPIETIAWNSFSFVENKTADFLTFMKFEEKHSIIKYLLNDIITRSNLSKEYFSESQELWRNWSNENPNNNIGKVNVLQTTDVFDCNIELNWKTNNNYLPNYSLLTVKDKSFEQFAMSERECSIWEWINVKQCILCNEIY